MRETNTIASKEKALALINHYGMVTLFPIKATSFPNLYQAIKGTREIKLTRTWMWSDQLAQDKHIHYGKLIRKQVTLLSLALFPAFFRLARERPLSTTAQRLLTYLRDHGKTSTTTLRKHLGFHTKAQKPAFLRAITELQTALAIAIVERGPPPRHTYTYDLMERWMPQHLLKKARSLPLEAARDKISNQMLNTQIISTPQDAKRFIKM